MSGAALNLADDGLRGMLIVHCDFRRRSPGGQELTGVKYLVLR